MRTSIRRLLLVNLLVCVAIIIGLTAVGAYYLGSNDLDILMDRELVHSSLVLSALLSPLKTRTQLVDVQHEFSQISSKEAQIFKLNPTHRDYKHSSLNEFPLQYQLLDKSGHLILQSNDAPTQPLSNGQPGFSDTYINNKSWRVFTSYNDKTGSTFIVGARPSCSANLVEAICSKR
jgi:two-component system sensor histidine kinase QseC